MRMRGIMGMMAIAALGMGAPVAAAQAAEKAIAPTPSTNAARKKSRIKRTPSGGLFKPIRSKAAPERRKLKGNRNHVSKRVRRKHRRAA